MAGVAGGVHTLYKIRGLTNASATIDTIQLDYMNDGSWRFTLPSTYLAGGDDGVVFINDQNTKMLLAMAFDLAQNECPGLT